MLSPGGAGRTRTSRESSSFWIADLVMVSAKMRAGSPTAIQPRGTVAPAGRTVREIHDGVDAHSAAQPIRAPLKTVAPVAIEGFGTSTMQPVGRRAADHRDFPRSRRDGPRTPRTTAYPSITRFSPIVTLPLSAVITARSRPSNFARSSRPRISVRRDARRCVDGSLVRDVPGRLSSFVMNTAPGPPLATS